MTTAKIKYRTYVPYGWIAIEFCYVEFFGDNNTSLEKEWHDIKFKKYREKQPTIDSLNARNIDLKKDEDILRNQINFIHKWWKIFGSKNEKLLWNQVFNIRENMNNINNEIKKHESDLFYSASELKHKTERFLESKGFIFDATSSAGSECVTHTDVWKFLKGGKHEAN